MLLSLRSCVNSDAFSCHMLRFTFYSSQKKTVDVLPEQPLELKRRPPPSSTLLTTLSTPASRLYLQKAAQAADESWQQTVHGHKGPTITRQSIPGVVQSGSPPSTTMTTPNQHLLHRTSRLSAPQLHAPLSRLSDRTRLRQTKTRCTPKERCIKQQELRICVARMSPINGFTS